MTTSELSPLSPQQWQAVQAGRRALAETIARAYPQERNRLAAVAIAGGFSDLCRASVGSDDLVAVINFQLADAGLELRRVRRQ